MSNYFVDGSASSESTGRTQCPTIETGAVGYMRHDRLDVFANPLGVNGFAVIADMAYQVIVANMFQTLMASMARLAGVSGYVGSKCG